MRVFGEVPLVTGNFVEKPDLLRRGGSSLELVEVFYAKNLSVPLDVRLLSPSEWIQPRALSLVEVDRFPEQKQIRDELLPSACQPVAIVKPASGLYRGR
jgi:hypothetical protein